MALATGGLASASSASAFSLVAPAGDIACDPDSPYFNRGFGRGEHCRQRATSRLLSDAAAVLTLGDTQYEHSSLSIIRASYNRSWGRYKSRTHPAIGNHEYAPGVRCGPTRCPTNRGASGYFDYFGKPCRPSRPSLLLLQRRRVAHGGSQQHVLDRRRLWGGLAARALAASRPGRAPEQEVCAGLLAPRALLLGTVTRFTYYRAFWRALHQARAT